MQTQTNPATQIRKHHLPTAVIRRDGQRAAFEIRRIADTLSAAGQRTGAFDEEEACVLTQRVLGALRQRFPAIQGPKKDDICYATQNRQDAVKALASQCDLVVVVGSPNSSNSRRLKEVALGRGVAAYLIDGAAEIDPEWLVGKRSIGVSAGASAPEILVRQVVDRLRVLTDAEVAQLAGIEEGVSFALPKELNA